MVINCLNIEGINNEIYQQFRNEVSEQRRKRADKFYFIEDSYRCICAELLLQFSLFEAAGKYIPIEPLYNKFGKPYIKNSPFFYNISHSGDWVVLVYGENEVGIDVEKVRDKMDDIIEPCFNESEKEYIYAIENSRWNERITEMWTRKESYVKYKGTGLTTELKSFSVNKIDGTVINEAGEIEEGLFIKTCELSKEYYMSICGKKEDIHIFKMNIDELHTFVFGKRMLRECR